MRMMYRVLLAGAALTALSGCDKQQSNRPDAIQAELDKAEQDGWIIDGYQDVDGIKRVVGKFANDINQQNAKIDAEMRGAMDAREAAEFARMARELALANLAIESIEFVPGLSAPKGSNPEDVIRGLGPSGDWGGAPENEYVPGFPSLGSIAGQDAGGGASWPRPAYDQNGNRLGTAWHVTTPRGRTASYVSLDGHLTGTASEYRDSDGTRHREEKYLVDGQFIGTRTITDDGDSVVVVTKEEGQETQKTVYTAAEWEEMGRRARGETDAPEAGGGSEEADDEVLPNPYTGIQPSDGMGGGRFCPLILDVCRRAMERALASREKVQAGVILINPGEPDDQPRGPRLKFDTGGLVINPSPDAGVNTSRDPRTFRMRLPVWVLPPKPIFGGSANTPTPPGN